MPRALRVDEKATEITSLEVFHMRCSNSIISNRPVNNREGQSSIAKEFGNAITLMPP